MRIALVVPGGVSRDGEYRVIPAILWLIERLARRHDVHVVALRQEPRPATWDLLGATVHNVGRRPRRLLAVRTLLKLHAVRPFDLFHAIWARGPGEVALACARVTCRPALVHVAGGELVWLPDVRFGTRRPWQRALSRLVLADADHVSVASGLMETLAQAAAGTVTRVTLGVDTARWTPVPPRPRARDRPARLVQVASLTPVKDQPTLLRAMAQLIRSGTSIHLDLVGEDALEGAIQRTAAELGLARYVTFHGFLPQRQVMRVVQAADLLVVSSRHEAGPVVFLEAAAVGVPTVGTAVGHLADLAPEAALAVRVGDAEALAGAIETLLDDDAQRMAIARHAQQFALREDADWTCVRFEALYAQVCGRRR